MTVLVASAPRTAARAENGQRIALHAVLVKHPKRIVLKPDGPADHEDDVAADVRFAGLDATGGPTRYEVLNEANLGSKRALAR